MQPHDLGIRHASCPALIGAGRIDEAVAQHPVATFERRPDHPLDMVGTRGGEQQRLDARAPAVGAACHQQVADRLRPRRAARLPRRYHGQATRAQCLGEAGELRRFADALPPFERDEATRQRQTPKKDQSPAHARRKNPASPTAFSATSGITCGGVEGVSTTRSAMCWPAAMGALIGPS